MQTRRVIVAGGRDFESVADAFNYLNEMKPFDVEIVCGGAKGADAIGEYWATLNHKEVKYFPADWETHGKAAGHIRNRQMAEYATHLIAFWDGKSRGTKNMIQTAEKLGLEVLVINYEVHNEKLDSGALRRIYRVWHKHS